MQPPPPPAPPLPRRILETIHLSALGIWLGAVIATGVFAAIVFGAVRELDPTLPAFAAYGGSHADLLAGFVQNRVFAAVDIAQFACAFLALASMIGLITIGKLPLNRWSSGLRMLGLSLAMGLVSFYLLVLMPRMAENVRAYWSAAEQGQSEQAAESKAAFDADHPTASNTLQGVAASVALALLAGAFSASSGALATKDDKARAASKARPTPPAREEPALLKSRRA